MLRRATLLAASSQGEVSPFPFSGCVLVSRKLKVLAETFQYASGTTPASLLATALASEDELKGSTLYMNLEPAYSLGEEAAVEAIVAAQAKRVVLGVEHPLVHLRGRAIEALRRAGVRVDCLRTHLAADIESVDAKDLLSRDGMGSPHLEYGGGDSLQIEMVRTLVGCLEVNENLLHNVAKAKPLCVLKYAMTLDGKTASVSGHSAWISGTQSRQKVYKQRALCDCVVVGGETVRSDNPNLTTRRGEGHVPTRVVVSRTMDLPTECNLWDTQIAPTLVITERAKNPEIQAKLRNQGVEVVELESLTLEGVVEHLYDRGFMRVLWECGGALAGPGRELAHTHSLGLPHQSCAVETSLLLTHPSLSLSLSLSHSSCDSWLVDSRGGAAISEGVINKVMAFVAPKIIGGTAAPTPVGDALGLTKMTDALDVTDVRYEQVDQDVLAIGYLPSSRSLFHVQRECYALPVPSEANEGAPSQAPASAAEEQEEREFTAVRFYKAWNQYGLLSNFFCLPIEIDDRVWKSVEHYYQVWPSHSNDAPTTRQTGTSLADPNNLFFANSTGRFFR